MQIILKCATIILAKAEVHPTVFVTATSFEPTPIKREPGLWVWIVGLHTTREHEKETKKHPGGHPPAESRFKTGRVTARVGFKLHAVQARKGFTSRNDV